jgi:hypothetical protein
MRGAPMANKCGDKPDKKEKKYTCSKCGASANKKDDLCRPVK